MADPQTIEILARQSARWSTAAGQDESPLIRLLHANYGVAYASALRQIAGDHEIQNVVGVSGRWLEQQATQVQDHATLNAVHKAPVLAPKGPLVALAREGAGKGAKGRYGTQRNVSQRIGEGFIIGLGVALAKAVLIVGGGLLAGTAIGGLMLKTTRGD